MMTVQLPFMITRYLCHCLQEISINRLILVCITCIYNFLGCTTAFANKYHVISYPTSGYSSHFYKVPYTGHFTAVNGSYFDASQYYKSQRVELNISGFTAVFLNEAWTLKFDWTFDQGFYSDLYQVGSSLKSNVTFIKSLENAKIELGLQNAILMGGSVQENACIDTLKREFHCGTGLPWSDYEGYELPQDLGLVFRFSFFF